MKIAAFRKIVWDFYKRNKRAMPWREGITPYRVLVSEVMLQQTQVARVMEKFPSFIKAFPNFKALRDAPLREVLSAWQGMGYNRRAMYLKKAAETVVQKHGGRLPQGIASLESLPGVGPATARSIVAFARNAPEAFIETNIRSVFLHHFFPNREGVPDAELLPIVQKALDMENPREWNYALMDYGAWLKREIGNPSRRSAHHAKQKAFKGSDRETRGKIVKLLAHGGKYSASAIVRVIGDPQDKVAANLAKLVREGLIAKHGRCFTITP